MTEIRTIGVVGLGAMGGGIAQLGLQAGYDVVGCEVTSELGDKAHARIAHFLTRKAEKGELEQVVVDAAIERLSTTTSPADLEHCELVIEAIVEELEPSVRSSASSTGSAGPRRCSPRTPRRSR